jgi:hypothetical protein
MRLFVVSLFVQFNHPNNQRKTAPSAGNARAEAIWRLSPIVDLGKIMPMIRTHPRHLRENASQQSFKFNSPHIFGRKIV